MFLHIPRSRPRRIVIAKLIYSVITSLDGYISDSDGSFDWAVPSEEAHEFINERIRSIGTYLMGRRMYETMVYWETALTVPDQPSFAIDFAEIWQEADKVVYSTTLNDVASKRTRIHRTFDPEWIRKQKAEPGPNFSIGGPDLAAQAIQAGLVDEYEIFVVPVLVGGGHRYLPEGVRVELGLLDQHRFTNGMVFLRYGAQGVT